MSISEADLTRVERAIERAKRSRHRFRMGAVLVHSGRILAEATNKSRNNPLYVDFRYCSVHAEHGVLRQAHHTKGATVYVARVLRDNSPALARPCPRCVVALLEAKIDRVVWTTPDGVDYLDLKDVYGNIP